MTRSRLLKTAALLLSLIMIFSVFAPAASADYSWGGNETMTYYFLAPDDWFKTSEGAYNEQVGAFWWQGENVPDKWPGTEMTPAPEVGENVFKVDNMSWETATIIFNAFLDAGSDEELLPFAHQTLNINTEGYDGDCPYDIDLSTDSFDGWIYVLNRDSDLYDGEYTNYHTYDGAWFTLDDYKNHSDYYGTYNFSADSGNQIDKTTDRDVNVGNAKYRAGDKITVDIEIGNLYMRDGGDANLAAYNYMLNYDPDCLELNYTNKNNAVEFLLNQEGLFSTSNGENPGSVLFSEMSVDGIEGDYSSNVPVARIRFVVTKDTDDLGIVGECTSLTAASKDGSTTDKLVGELSSNDYDAGLTEDDMTDKYTVAVINSKSTSTDTDKKTDTDTSSEITTDCEGDPIDGKYHVGDKITVEIEIGNLHMRNGDDANLAAYNYTFNYDPDCLELVPTNKNKAAEFLFNQEGQVSTSNGETSGTVKLGEMASEGIEADYSTYVPVARIRFNVTKDTDDPGFFGECTSLTVVSKDGSTTEKLVGSLGDSERMNGYTEADMVDKYTVIVINPKSASTDTDEITDTDTSSQTTDTDTSSQTTDTEEERIYHVGDTVTAEIRIGGLRMSNGSPAKLIAYNYDVYYNPNCLEVVPNGDQLADFLIYSRDKNNMSSEEELGKISLADMDYEGMNGNFTKMITVAKITFKVTLNTTKLGISGDCRSLSVVRMNNADTETLDGSKYSELAIDVSCPHVAPSTDSDFPIMVNPGPDKHSDNDNDTDSSNTSTDTDSGENQKTFFFDTGDWNSDRILFYIWDETAEPTMYASINGWEEVNRWGSKKLSGTMVGDGIFESYPVDIPEGHDVFVIFYDPETGIQTFDCVLTPEAYGDTARLTGTLFENPMDSEKLTYEVAFDKSGLTAKKTITSTGNIVGTTITPNMNGSMEVAKYILNYLGHIDKVSGEEVVTEEKVANAIDEFDTTPDEVWSSYQTFEDELNYQPEEAKKVIFGSDENSDQDVESDTDSSTTDTDSDKSSNNTPTPKGNNGDKGMVGDVDGDGIVNSGDAVMILRSSVGMDVVLLAFADVDRDQIITSSDAVSVLRFSVHLIDNIRIGRQIIN